MAQDSPIEWTDVTWNPTRGCGRVSPGCERCYAEKVAHRFSGPGRPYEGLVTMGKRGPRWNGEGHFVLDALDAPLHWRKPRKVFVNSMSDLFFEKFSSDEIAAVFGVMAACPHHTFQVLTKRPARAAEWFARNVDHLTECAESAARFTGDSFASMFFQGTAWPLSNVWIGVSIEDQQRADERLPQLLEIPATVRFVSYEPALGPVDFCATGVGDALSECDECNGDANCELCGGLPRIDWVIVGGESGAGARPFDLAWARSAVKQCQEAGVPVFVKQLGARPFVRKATAGSFEHEQVIKGGGHFKLRVVNMSVERESHLHLRDKKGGAMVEWPEELRVREFPEVRS